VALKKTDSVGRAGWSEHMFKMMIFCLFAST